jgi:hypothetical protein
MNSLLFGVPASSATLERVFSSSGQIFSRKEDNH